MIRLGILVLSILISHSALAKDPPMVNKDLIIGADSMDNDFKTRTSQLSGNVQVVYKGQHISCDRATVDYKNEVVQASGNVKFQTPSIYAEASSLRFDFGKDTATLNDGLIQAGQVVLEGKLIEKTGANTYVATDAHYTACMTCPPAWSFSGKRIEAEMGGYARIDRPIMRIGGVPTIILPWILVPLKSARQSGLLVPSLDFSGKNLAISLSYFWAISQSQDMTFTLKSYTTRGFKGLGEYRYVLSPTSKGQLNMAYIRDRIFKRDNRLVLNENNVDRWFAKYEHYYEMPDNYVQRATVNQTSDLRYTRDFPDEIPGHGDPALNSRISLTKTYETQEWSAEADYYNNLLKTYALAPNDDSVHKLPELRYSMLDRRILNSPILFRFDSTYTNFARPGFSYDDMSISAGCPGGAIHCANVGPKGEIPRDGKFDDGKDKIRTGQRLDLRPTLSMPFRLFKVFEITPSVHYREMQYRFNVDIDPSTLAPGRNYLPTAAQRYLETGVTAKTTLSHVFGDMSNPQSTRVKHEIEPQLTFASIPWKREADHAFFGNYGGQRYSRIDEPISDSDLYDSSNPNHNGLQFDYEDRLFEKRIVELAITNRLTRKRWRDGIPSYQRIMNFKLSQSYDFKEANKGAAFKPQPWSPIVGMLNFRLDNFETYSNASYNTYAKVTNSSVSMRLFDLKRENFLQATYERVHLFNARNEVINANTKNLGFGAGFVTKWLMASGGVEYSAFTSKIYAWNYTAILRPPGNCWTLRFDHKQVISNPNVDFKATFAFDFGGEENSKMAKN